MNQMIETAGKSLWELVAARATTTPDKQMARDEAGRTMTFARFRDRCVETAAGLAALGVGHGTAVSWSLASNFESLVLVGALSRLGATQNPILPIYRHREFAFITAQSRAEMLIVPPTYRGVDFVAMADQVTGELDHDCRVVVVDTDLPVGDPATLSEYPLDPGEVRWLFYSSGTTADPKGAKHTDLSISAANAGMQSGCFVGPTDKTAVVFPITHVGGLVWLFNSMQTGVELLMVEAFDPATVPKWLSDNGCTCAGAGTFFFQTYLGAQRQSDERLLPDVRIFNGGGAPKPISLHGELKETFGAPLLNGWGLTEAPIVTMASIHDPDDKLATTEGKVVPGSQLRVVLDGQVLGPNAEGELQVKGPQVCSGYLDSALDDDAFVDGWFRTGDLGMVDDDGYVTITGRLKDVIIRKGENISAKEIEDLLHAHPQIGECAVIGLPDAERGERACAVVVTAGDEPIEFDQMTDHLMGASLSKHKLPEQLEFVDALPRNPTGKILKKDLRARFG